MTVGACEIFIEPVETRRDRTTQRTIPFSLQARKPVRWFRAIECFVTGLCNASTTSEFYRYTRLYLCVMGATGVRALARIVRSELTVYENRHGQGRAKKELQNAFGGTNFAWKHDCLHLPRAPDSFLRLFVFTLSEATSRYCFIGYRCELYVIK